MSEDKASAAPVAPMAGTPAQSQHGLQPIAKKVEGAFDRVSTDVSSIADCIGSSCESLENLMDQVFGCVPTEVEAPSIHDTTGQPSTQIGRLQNSVDLVQSSAFRLERALSRLHEHLS